MLAAVFAGCDAAFAFEGFREVAQVAETGVDGYVINTEIGVSQFSAGEYQTTSVKTTPNSPRHFPLTPAFAGGCRYPIGRDARQAVGMPKRASTSPHPKPPRF